MRLILGDDQAGIALEVLAVEDARGDFVVIHAMKMRRKHRHRYQEAALANRSVTLKSGRVLDDDLIEKPTSEAERGFDLRAQTDHPPTRYASPRPADRRSPRVTSRVPGKVTASP